MRVLVTGAEGFVASHLKPLLAANGHTVISTTRSIPAESQSPFGPVVQLDLPCDDQVAAVLKEQKPDVVIHLAAMAAVGDCEANPESAYRANVEGTASLVRSMALVCKQARFIFISTSNIYGPAKAEYQPIHEDLGGAPVNVYAWTKLAAESWLQVHASLLDSPPTILRPFNHVGPGQSSIYALPGFAKQIVQIERGELEPVVRVGNLKVRRDIMDVRDVVKAYLKVIESPQLSGTFNICSGEAFMLSDLLDQMAASASVPVEVAIDPARLRPNDLELLYGSSQKFKEATSWQAEYSMDQTLESLLADWRERLAAGASGQ